jgi:hypothetical protein
MTTRRHWRPTVEALEARTLLSAGLGHPALTLAPVVHHGQHHRHRHHRAHHAPGAPLPGDPQQALALGGQVNGAWLKQPTLPDVGGDQTLTGTGTVGPLGTVTLSGELHTPGFIAQGTTTGTVTLSNADGSVTLRLVGPPQPGFSPPPATFHYTITGGTDKFAGASGQGTVTFQEQETPPLVCPPNAMCLPLAGGTFTMTFQPSAA